MNTLYIAYNEQGLIKIGFTDQLPQDRVNQFSTDYQTPFYLAISFNIEDIHATKLERFMHEICNGQFSNVKYLYNEFNILEFEKYVNNKQDGHTEIFLSNKSLIINTLTFFHMLNFIKLDKKHISIINSIPEYSMDFLCEKYPNLNKLIKEKTNNTKFKKNSLNTSNLFNGQINTLRKNNDNFFSKSMQNEEKIILTKINEEFILQNGVNKLKIGNFLLGNDNVDICNYIVEHSYEKKEILVEAFLSLSSQLKNNNKIISVQHRGNKESILFKIQQLLKNKEVKKNINSFFNILLKNEELFNDSFNKEVLKCIELFNNSNFVHYIHNLKDYECSYSKQAIILDYVKKYIFNIIENKTVYFPTDIKKLNNILDVLNDYNILNTEDYKNEKAVALFNGGGGFSMSCYTNILNNIKADSHYSKYQIEILNQFKMGEYINGNEIKWTTGKDIYIDIMKEENKYIEKKFYYENFLIQKFIDLYANNKNKFPNDFFEIHNLTRKIDIDYFKNIEVNGKTIGNIIFENGFYHLHAYKVSSFIYMINKKIDQRSTFESFLTKFFKFNNVDSKIFLDLKHEGITLREHFIKKYNDSYLESLRFQMNTNHGFWEHTAILSCSNNKNINNDLLLSTIVDFYKENSDSLKNPYNKVFGRKKIYILLDGLEKIITNDIKLEINSPILDIIEELINSKEKHICNIKKELLLVKEYINNSTSKNIKQFKQ